jgi:hypothetical protein
MRAKPPSKVDGGFLLPAVAAAALAAAVLYALAALAAPVGGVADDAMNILLARSLSHGAFALPDARGVPMNDPLPGFPALLCLPALLVDPRWDLLKLLGLASAAAVVALTWRLARRLLDARAAFAATALTALSPLLLQRSVLVVADVPCLAFSLLLLERLEPDASPAALAGLSALGALVSLLRPTGALLVAAVALALAAARGWRRAAAFSAPSVLALALWSARNRLATGAGSGYAVNLAADAASLAEPRAAFAHAAGLAATLGGRGLLSLGSPLPLAALAAAGLAAAAALGLGARRALAKKPDARAFSMAVYAILLTAQHLAWPPLLSRYALPLLPLAWILMLAAVPPAAWRRAWPTALAALLALPALRQDLDEAAPGLRGPVRFESATMTWIRERTPPDAPIQSPVWNSLALSTGRPAEAPSVAMDERDAWLAWLLRRKVLYVHTVAGIVTDGYPSGADRICARLEPWARSTPYVREDYRNDAEGTAVFRVVHPDPARYLRAWDELGGALESLRRGGSRADARARLDAALALEPRLALAWLARAELETDARARRRDVERAAALDPTSDEARAALSRLGPERRP